MPATTPQKHSTLLKNKDTPARVAYADSRRCNKVSNSCTCHVYMVYAWFQRNKCEVSVKCNLRIWNVVWGWFAVLCLAAAARSTNFTTSGFFFVRRHVHFPFRSKRRDFSSALTGDQEDLTSTSSLLNAMENSINSSLKGLGEGGVVRSLK